MTYKWFFTHESLISRKYYLNSCGILPQCELVFPRRFDKSEIERGWPFGPDSWLRHWCQHWNWYHSESIKQKNHACEEILKSLSIKLELNLRIYLDLHFLLWWHWIAIARSTQFFKPHFFSYIIVIDHFIHWSTFQVESIVLTV